MPSCDYRVREIELYDTGTYPARAVWVVEEPHRCNCPDCYKSHWTAITGWFDSVEEAVGWVRERFPDCKPRISRLRASSYGSHRLVDRSKN